MSRNRALRKAVARSLVAMRSSPMVRIPTKSGLSKTELFGITLPPVAGVTAAPLIASGWIDDNKKMAAATRVEKGQKKLWLDLEAKKLGYRDFAHLDSRGSPNDVALARQNAQKRRRA